VEISTHIVLTDTDLPNSLLMLALWLLTTLNRFPVEKQTLTVTKGPIRRRASVER
jgi:hypothetical protein